MKPQNLNEGSQNKPPAEPEAGGTPKREAINISAEEITVKAKMVWQNIADVCAGEEFPMEAVFKKGETTRSYDKLLEIIRQFNLGNGKTPVEHYYDFIKGEKNETGLREEMKGILDDLVEVSGKINSE